MRIHPGVSMRHSFAVLFLLFVSTASAQAPTYALAEKIDALVRAEIDKEKFVGLAVVVIDEGTIAWSKGYGYADREKGVRVDPASTQFRWASISKPVTAVAALQLYEKGLLDLDADVRSYVPEFPDKGVKITARQLLCHQGGIVHYSNGKVVRTETTYSVPHPFAGVVTALDLFKESPLVNSPGTKYAYSTHGFILLSAVVERAGKQRFADQVTARIARPLGMAEFRPDYPWDDIPNRSIGYTRTDAIIAPRPLDQETDVSSKLGGGGFTSPAIDLARFGVGLLERKLVSKSTEQLMWTVNRPIDPQGAKPYGLGFFVIDRPGHMKIVGHDGRQEKTRTALMLAPEKKCGIAIMSNSEWGDMAELALKLLNVVGSRSTPQGPFLKAR
jgi:serine beta-lactamase-like protein LACTB, mitochondrial